MTERIFDPEAFLRAGNVLAARISRRQNTINWLRDTVGGGVSRPERTHSERGKQSGGETDIVGRYLDLEAEQKRDLDRMKRVGEAIQKEIEKIRDPTVFRIVVLRCIEELPWGRIADELKTEPRTVRRRYEKYLQSIPAPSIPDCEDLYYRIEETD